MGCEGHVVGRDSVHRRDDPRRDRDPPAACRQAWADRVTANTRVPYASAFGRAVVDIIAKATSRTRASDSADPAFSDPTRLAEASELDDSAKYPEGRLWAAAPGRSATDDGTLCAPWQWVMFAEPASGGVEFLGVFVTRAFSREDAVLKAYVSGHCPGGHAEAVALPAATPISATYLDRLLTLDECEALRESLGMLSNVTAAIN